MFDISHGRLCNQPNCPGCKRTRLTIALGIPIGIEMLQLPAPELIEVPAGCDRDAYIQGMAQQLLRIKAAAMQDLLIYQDIEDGNPNANG